MTLICTYIATNELLDVPYGIIVEACSRTNRLVSKPRVLVLQSPNYFNISSLIIDLLMLRYGIHQTS